MNKLLPLPARWIALAGIAIAMFVLGMLQGERVAGQQHVDYLRAQAARGMMITRAQTQAVVHTEIKYRDRIKTIYIKGEEIEKQVPVYVTAADNAECRINAGFVRTYDAAWAGESPEPAASTDRDAAGVSLTEVAEADAHNAAACRAWRELALGLREFYGTQKKILN